MAWASLSSTGVLQSKSYRAHLALFKIDGVQRSVLALTPNHLGHASVPVDITVDADALFMVRADDHTEVFEELPEAVDCAWKRTCSVHPEPSRFWRSGAQPHLVVR